MQAQNRWSLLGRSLGKFNRAGRGMRIALGAVVGIGFVGVLALTAPLTADAQVCAEDSFEPNNEQLSATLVTSGVEVSAHICQGINEDDWFKFAVAAGDVIHVGVLFSQAEADLDLWVHDENQQIVAGSLHGGSVSLVARSSGFYAAHVFAADNGEAPYQITVTITTPPPCTDDSFEPNNSPLSATELTSGVQVSGSICEGANEYDWYEFAVTEGDIIEIELTYNHADGDIDLQLYNEELRTRGKGDSSTNNESIKRIANSTGTWAIEVFPYYPEGIFRNSYNLTVTVTTDDVEPAAVIVSPIAGQTLAGSAVSITGTATDDVAVGRVRVTVRDRTTGLWMRRDGTMGAFGFLEATVEGYGTPSASWSLDTVLGDGEWKISAQAIDYAGNRDSDRPRVSFEVDTTPPDDEAPDTTITEPVFRDVLNSGAVTVVGSATDNVGVDAVRVALRNNETNEWLRRDGTQGAFQFLSATLGDPGTTETGWTFEVELPNGPWRAVAMAIDTAGNIDSSRARVFSFGVDG